MPIIQEVKVAAPTAFQAIAEELNARFDMALATRVPGNKTKSMELQMTDETKRMPSGLVDVGGVKAHINPSSGDIARMMERAPDYRLRTRREISDPPTPRFQAMLRHNFGRHGAFISRRVLRALREGLNHAIWPFFAATHGQMAALLGFTKDAARLRYAGRPGKPDSDYPNKAGSFSFFAAES